MFRHSANTASLSMSTRQSSNPNSNHLVRSEESSVEESEDAEAEASRTHGMIMYVYVFMNCIPSALVLDGLRMSKLAMCWNEVVGVG